MPAERALVLNRGEIAFRACAAARAAGLSPVLFAASGDLPKRLAASADAVHLCAGTTPADTFLDLDVVRAAIAATGATFLYPGYGFHSENAALATVARECSVRFVGPSPEILAQMADKLSASRFAEEVGLETLRLRLAPDEAPPAEAFPVLIKAVRGGGGRGNVVAHDPAEFASLHTRMALRAEQLFHDPRLLVERYRPSARHVELQFAAASGKAHPLGTRDCSVQRRFQKVIEEGEAPDGAGEALGRVAPALAEALGGLRYEGVGTLEFLWDAAAARLYFLEMNARIQVEHPVTEVLLGEDLVDLQFAIALGRPVDLASLAARSRGHAIELRVYAEKLAGGTFLPDAGELVHLGLPSLPFCRWDTAYAEGDVISASFDPMIAKLIVSGKTRASCISRARTCLQETVIHGVHTNVPLLLAVLGDDTFVRDAHDISWLERDLVPTWDARARAGTAPILHAGWEGALAAVRAELEGSTNRGADSRLAWKHGQRR